MTRHYVHIDNEAVKRAINALPQGNLLPESPDKSIKEKQAAKESTTTSNQFSTAIPPPATKAKAQSVTTQSYLRSK